MRRSCYLDASVLATPALKNRPGEVIAACADWLERIGRGELVGVTSVLSWDEVAWVIGRGTANRYDHERAIQAGRMLLALPNLSFAPADASLLGTAQAMLSSGRFRPRDAIHAATAAARGCALFLTLDARFERLRAEPGMQVEIIR